MSGISSGGLDFRAPIVVNDARCKHEAGFRYRVPTDGSEPYECVSCLTKFSWDEMEAMNVAAGGKPGAFVPIDR